MARHTWTIGEVINLLRDDFPDVTVSKLRFLEGQGLIDPGRGSSGYREFGDEDVSRIRYILQQQRDHFLPLKVIKSKLTAWERGEEPAASPGPSGPPPETYFAASEARMNAEELCRAAGITRMDLKKLLDHDVLEPAVDEQGRDVFGDEDLIVARSAARLLEHGLEARHLRVLRLSADRLYELLHQLTSPLLRHGNPETRRRAGEILAECAQAARDAQEAILRSELRRLTAR